MGISDTVIFASVPETQAELHARGYVADEALATSVFLAARLERPLFLEGAPGVGKTELAKVVSELLQTELVRLQCYEGLDLAQAAYEWNYPRQLLEIQARGVAAGGIHDLYTDEYLLRRPLLRAIDPARTRSAVLLIDEIDRADEAFESFLLELLSDYQITVPELGTLRAAHRPLVFLTSNRTREVHDALKRRCLYHWIDYPDMAKEVAILKRRVPGVSERLSLQVARFVERLRREELYKAPGVAESIDWAQALSALGVRELELPAALATAGCVLKHREDVDRLRGGLGEEILAAVSGG